ncbi:MAG: Xaa-Pro peptidase family protein [Bacteroidetes bacterium]|nr:Xaa-Pro peptidase family protein [Bacteroidota bacterium]
MTKTAKTSKKTPNNKAQNKKTKLTSVRIEHKPYPATINKRLHQIRFNMNENKIDAAFISYLPNIRYLTNYSGSWAYMLITTDEIYFFTDDRYEEQIITELYDLNNMRVHITRDVWKYIEDLKILETVKNIGIEQDHLSYAEATDIKSKMNLIGVRLKPLSDLVDLYTQAKAPEELECIKKSCNIAEEIFEYILDVIRPGITELDIAIEIDYQARLHGSEGTPFDTIVTSGERGALVHGQPSHKKIKKGDIVLMDFGCKINGFCSDISRTVCCGKPKTEQKKIYKLLYNAMSTAIEEARPGMKGDYLDNVARKIIKDAGYGDYFKHSLGHGIGLICHERPTITFRLQDQIIHEDTVLAIEPGIYIPKQFGMRVEDNALIGHTKNTKLTNAPEELIQV